MGRKIRKLTAESEYGNSLLQELCQRAGVGLMMMRRRATRGHVMTGDEKAHRRPKMFLPCDTQLSRSHVDSITDDKVDTNR